MIRHALQVHPTSASAGQAIEVTLQRDDAGNLQLHYLIPGVVVLPAMPAKIVPSRRDGLWQHTCAELFVGGADGRGYREFNFAPSGDWATYDFSAYRQLAPAQPDLPAPTINTRHASGQVRIEVTLAAACLPDVANARLGVSMVIELADGQRTYWALHHAAPTPDFHHPASFILSLP